MAKKTQAVSDWATQTASAWAGELERVGKLVKVGMSEAELIKAVGEPRSRDASGTTLFYGFTFGPPPFWEASEAFPQADVGLSVSKKKKYEGRMQIGWSAGDPNGSMPDAEFQAVAVSIAALLTPVHGPAAKGKGKLKEFTFPEAKGVKLTVTGGLSYQTAQLTVVVQPA